MKRASLKSMKVSVLANPSPDVTDRILKSEGEEAQGNNLSRASTTLPRPPKPRRARKTIASASDSKSPPVSPVPAASASVSSPDTISEDAISEALTQTRLALEALNMARHSAPARYSLAVRFRLDSLAHHLEQVTQFVTAQTL